MSDIGHNGGPPMGDDAPGLTYVKFYPRDWLTGTMDMSLEERGAYMTVVMIMYDRMGGFPYDERLGGVLMRCDKRVYRRVRDRLLAEGKLYRDGDMLRNPRVEREITDYITQYKRRSEAARERERKRELHRTSGELRPEVREKSGTSSGEVREKFDELGAKNATKSTKREAQNGSTRARYQNPEPEPDKSITNVSYQSAREPTPPTTGAASGPIGLDMDELSDRLIGACNGALDNPVNCQGLLNLSTPLMWIDQGCDLDRDILPTLVAVGKARHGARIRSWGYFSGAIAKARDARLAGLPPPDASRPAKKSPHNFERDRALLAKLGVQNVDDLIPE